MRRMLRVLNIAAQLKQLLLQKRQKQKKVYLQFLNICSHVVYFSAQKGAFALQLPPVCSGEAFWKLFLELHLAARFSPQPKPTVKNHCKEWIQLFLPASISHDPDLPQGLAVRMRDMVNLDQWKVQQSPETNVITWLMTGILFEVPQEVAVVISQANEVLVSTADVWVSAQDSSSPCKGNCCRRLSQMSGSAWFNMIAALRLVNNFLEGCQERILQISCVYFSKTVPYCMQANCHILCLPLLFLNSRYLQFRFCLSLQPTFSY